MPAIAPTPVSTPGTHWTVDDPARLATLIRLRAVRMVAPHGFGYLGQALSSAEQVAALVLINRTSTAHGLSCLPPDADGHFIKLPPDLAARAEAELTALLERRRG